MRNFKYYLTLTSILFLTFVFTSFISPVYSQSVATCDSGSLQPGNGEDLEIITTCMVGAGTYNYGYVNIYNGGELIFDDAVINFWAESILIEKDSALIADSIGNNGLLTIHLYGSDVNSPDTPPITCKTDDTCGVDPNNWTSTPGAQIKLPGTGSPEDYFYAYDNLPYYVNGVNTPNNQGFFGHKVLAVSYGGTLILNGVKGSSLGDLDPSDSGTSWARLDATISKNSGKTLTLDRAVDWKEGDQIVVTTTDYLPGNSEQFTIDNISPDGKTITVVEEIEHIHNGEKYPIKTADRITDGIDRLGLKFDKAETRAAVALLSRSIRIVSEGNDLNSPLDASDYYGGHTIFRQGFEKIQVQGVEFYQMGQGGRLGRYPVNFRLARKTPSDTYLKDNSIHDSMTRWITLQGTHGVLLERNVGYKSIGHGFYLADGTEIENKFYSNIGIFARAAVDNIQNPRKVPGILSAPGEENQQQLGKENVPFHSDFHHPTIFWIMNSWNDFEYNMAAGAGTCGNCYWLVPGSNSGPSRDKKWDSYASLQVNESNAGTTPLKKFKGNYCSSASIAFNTVGSTFQCLGVGAGNPAPKDEFLRAIPNDNTPAINDEFVFTPPDPQPPLTLEARNYYPIVGQGTSRIATRCDSKSQGAKVGQDGGLDCSGVARCSEANSKTNCNVTVIDEFTTSFNWTETNFSAIWLRPQWFLVSNSFISDVQSAGLTFVTGGDYTKASSPTGNWLLAYKNTFVGNTQENNPLASNAGPVGPGTGALSCDSKDNTINYCLLKDEGISVPLSNFANNQRLFNIYDGPAQQDSNAYLDITATKVNDCNLNNNGGNCQESKYMYGRIPGMPFSSELNSCILPNAAIAWKQPNGFYYPPSFHSANLYFDKVDIRHFIINPLFETGTRKTNLSKVEQNYCTHSGGGTFTGFTEIDRQTVLNDDDGSLTGYQRTISVNEDPFFNAPIEAFECASNMTAKTSPYEYVTTAIYPACAANLDGDPNPEGTAIGRCGNTLWASQASDQATYAVPMYRQCLTGKEMMGDLQDQSPSIRLMGMNMWQRSNLTPINAKFYIDTTVSENSQNTPFKNVFRADNTYYVYLIYATSNTKQVYELYVGEGFDVDSVKAVQTPLLVRNLSFNEVNEIPGTWNVEYFDKDHPMFDTHPNILRVTVDMSFPEFKEGLAKEKIRSCAPSSFCEWSDSVKQCRCSETLKKEDPEAYKVCSQDNGQGEHAVCRWSGIDVDCPEGGCYGFSFTLPSGFETEDCNETIGSQDQCGRTVSAGGKRPDIECFPTGLPWEVPWISAKDGIAGKEPVCTNSPVEPKNFCDAPPTEAPVARNLIIGTEGDDYLSGTPESDVIRGLGGDDLIFGLDGNDFIQGGPGDDLIFGGRDDDTIQGGSGDDNLDGHTGNDSIDGGGGFDIVDGGSDNDTCENHEDSFDCEVQN